MRPWCVHTCRRRTRSRSIDPRRVAVIPASRVPIGQFAARFARYRVTKDVVEEACCLDDARPPAITHRRPPPRNHGVGRPIRIIDKYRYFSLHAAPGPTTMEKSLMNRKPQRWLRIIPLCIILHWFGEYTVGWMYRMYRKKLGGDEVLRAGSFSRYWIGNFSSLSFSFLLD